MSNTITINYKKLEYAEKEYEISMGDLHYCFLEGSNEDYNIKEYLGIWTTDKELKICEIKYQDTITIRTYSYKNIYTHSCFKKFLEEHHTVEKISEERFMNELNKILKKIK